MNSLAAKLIDRLDPETKLELMRRADTSTTQIPVDDPEDEIVQETPILHADALYGLAGDIVRDVDPYTEANSTAVLAHVLAGFGSIAGYFPHALVGAERHPARLYIVLVGSTSTGRKGSSWGPPKEIFKRSDPDWIQNCVKTGASSGEGLIYHVRDEIGNDPGITDKRLLTIETEFGSTLAIMGRQGNSLSGVMRQAWDDGTLSTLTKNQPVKATGAHITIVGHVTRDELLRNLDGTEKANGFANRFIWLAVERSKFLPDGDAIPESILDNLASRMRDTIQWAKGERCLKRDPMAAELWRAVYPRLNADRPGMSGAILGRAAAQTLRLSLVFALLDKSPSIRTEHLRAALAVWDVAEKSVFQIFGDRIGDPVADRILDELRTQHELTRDDIVNLFHRHRTGAVGTALSLLEKCGRIMKESRQTGGRPVSVYRIAR